MRKLLRLPKKLEPRENLSHYTLLDNFGKIVFSLKAI